MPSTRSDRDPLAASLQLALAAEPADLAAIALILAKLEYPALDPAPSLHALDRLGTQARALVDRVSGGSIRARVTALNTLLFEQEGFTGDFSHYDDFRNNYLNAVLERRLGIPITLALVYMEVARRANVDVQGVAFPGHFLMHVPLASERTRVSPRERSGAQGAPARERVGGSAPFGKNSGRPERRRGAGAEPPGLVLDPFDAGAELDVADCRKLLGRHLGTTGDEAPFDPGLLRPCSPRQMVARMLNNLKRTYLESRSYARARRVTDLLLAVEPTAVSELRDRGLLAYHLDDFPAALRDLEDYCRLRTGRDDPDQEELEQILDHVKTLRRRIGTMN